MDTSIKIHGFQGLQFSLRRCPTRRGSRAPRSSGSSPEGLGQEKRILMINMVLTSVKHGKAIKIVVWTTMKQPYFHFMLRGIMLVYDSMIASLTLIIIDPIPLISSNIKHLPETMV